MFSNSDISINDISINDISINKTKLIYNIFLLA